LLDDGPDLAARGHLVAGARYQNRGLMQRTKNNVRERIDRLSQPVRVRHALS
jgi:hypothetical protein